MHPIIRSVRRKIPRGLVLALMVFVLVNVGSAKEPKKTDTDRPKKVESQRPFEGSIWKYSATREEKGDKFKKEGIFRLEDKAFTPIRKRVGDTLVEQFDVQVTFGNFPDLKGGRAFLKRETDDFWKGYYLDEKRERWKFELRRDND